MSDIERRVLILETQLQRTQKTLAQAANLAARALQTASQAGGSGSSNNGSGLLMIRALSGGTAGSGRSGTTPGSVSVQGVTWDGTALNTATGTFTAYTLATTGTAASKYLWLVSDDNGTSWWVLFEDCG